MGTLLVVHDDGARRDVREQGVFHPLGRRLAVPAYDGDGVLESVYRLCDADLVLGQTPLRGIVRAPHDVGVGQVELVNPDPPVQHEAVLAAVYGGEDPMAPFEGGRVRNAAHLGAQVERSVVAHAGDEALPGRKLLLPVLEHGPAE